MASWRARCYNSSYSLCICCGGLLTPVDKRCCYYCKLNCKAIINYGSFSSFIIGATGSAPIILLVNKASLRFPPSSTNNRLQLLSLLALSCIIWSLLRCYSDKSPIATRSKATPFFFNFLAIIFSYSILSEIVDATKQIIRWPRLEFARCFRAKAEVWSA